MGRTGTDENKQANAQASQWQQDAVNATKAQVGIYNKDLSTLKSGGDLAPNPWMNPEYLRNLNVKNDASLSSANDDAVNTINHQALRTGENSEAAKATVADLARSKMRMNNELTAGQYADNYNNGRQYQQMLLGSDLAPTGADTSLFSTATGQRTGSLKNLADIGMAGQQMWGNIIGAGLQAGGTIGAKAV